MRFYIKIIMYSIIIFVVFNSTTVFANSASLFIDKKVSNIQEGEQITLDVNVKSNDQAINAVSGIVIFPSEMLRMVSISKDNSILNIWTRNPSIQRNQISFEGVVLNPGYQGNNGNIFRVTFEAKKHGLAVISFSNGAILANDGVGTNIVSSLKSTSFNIIGTGVTDLINKPIAKNIDTNKSLALPVITDYSLSINSGEDSYFKGKGEPNQLTKMTFEAISQKSLGEQFIDFIQYKKKRLTDAFVKNNEKGLFEYVTPSNLIAGVYNVVPFLVDNKTNIDKPGIGVQLFVNDSKIIKELIVFINILVLFIPIVVILLFIYFIIWYSFKRMHVLKRKMISEEEKIEINDNQSRDQSYDQPYDQPYDQSYDQNEILPYQNTKQDLDL